MKKFYFFCLMLAGLEFGCMTLTSCGGNDDEEEVNKPRIIEVDSELRVPSNDYTLDTPGDTLYSIMGIIQQMQVIAYRTLLLGEIRADLMQINDNATTDIKALTYFPMTDSSNTYNCISDYYAIINNCNYYIAHVDPNNEKYKGYRNEYIAVKVFRAWTYLQLAKIYEKVPLVLEPILSTEDAQKAENMPYSDILKICDYFIGDLSQYVGSKDDAELEYPQYGLVSGFDSRKFFIPLRVILGEMCLWVGRYTEAATYLHDFLTKTSNPVTTGKGCMSWSVGSDHDFSKGTIHNDYIKDIIDASSASNITFIPVELLEYGMRSHISTMYNTVVPSATMKSLSREENYVMEYVVSPMKKDTIYASKDNLSQGALAAGDLRLYGSYPSEGVISKLPTDFIPIYRSQYIYLLFAEALNRAGYPHSAFAVLKYGLRNEENLKRIPAEELMRAGELVNFPNDTFTENNTIGIHARGCGDTHCDKKYVIEKTITDTTNPIIMVEDLIVNEMALETAFEGQRYYTLMRIAMRRNDNSYLAEPISKREGTKNLERFNKLMNRDNWYLPIHTK